MSAKQKKSAVCPDQRAIGAFFIAGRKGKNMKFLSIEEAGKQLARDNPGGALTAHSLRMMARAGKLPGAFKVGSRTVICYEKMVEGLGGGGDGE